MLIVHGVLLLYVCLVTHILTLESMDFFVLLSVALITIIHLLKKLCLLLIWNSIEYTPFSGYAQCTQDEFLDSPKPVDLFLAILHVLEENSRLF